MNLLQPTIGVDLFRQGRQCGQIRKGHTGWLVVTSDGLAGTFPVVVILVDEGECLRLGHCFGAIPQEALVFEILIVSLNERILIRTLWGADVQLDV